MDTSPTNGNTEAIPISNGKILVIVPFYIDGKEDNTFNPIEDSIITESDSCIWQKSTSPLTNEGEACPIYAHIMSFLQNGENGVHDSDDIITYNLATKSTINSFWNKFSNSTHTAHTKKGQIQFKFERGNKTIDTPHIFLSPTTRTGLITFGIYLCQQNDASFSDDLIYLNYALHSIDHPDPCTADGMKHSENPDLPQDTQQKRRDSFNTFRDLIKKSKLGKDVHDLTPNDLDWDLLSIIDLFQRDIKNIHFFVPQHIHSFVYCHITNKGQKYTPVHIRPILYRLSHSINNKRLIPSSSLTSDTNYIQTFDNIYISTAIESTAFLNLSEDDISSKQLYDNVIKTRYLWIYILAVIQRYSLRNIDQQLVKLVTNDFNKANGRDTTNKSKQLWTIIKNINKIKIHCHYTDISILSQHNDFYNQCCEKLNINSAYKEIDAKLSVLHQTIDNEETVEQKARDKKIEKFLVILAGFEAAATLFALCDVSIDLIHEYGCIKLIKLIFYIIILILVISLAIYLINKNKKS